MKKFLIISGLILGSSLFPIKAIAATFSQIIVYGDSLSDLGRVSVATGGAAPPYTQGNGKFSNGNIWIEYLADSLGIATTPNTNFAVGGATTGTANTIQPLISITIPALVGVQQEIIANPISDPDALYVVWAGANDYLGSTIPTNPAVSIANLSSEITTLISRGAKNILVPNLADLGKLPATLNTTNSASLDTLTLVHNTGLAASINSLSQANPGVNLNLLDVNSLFNQVVNNPSSFGFDNVTNQCITASSVCGTPDTYLFWDYMHPTTAGHKLIGELAFNTVSPTAAPEPTTMLGSIVAFGSVVALKRKMKSSKLKAKELVKSA